MQILLTATPNTNKPKGYVTTQYFGNWPKAETLTKTSAQAIPDDPDMETMLPDGLSEREADSSRPENWGPLTADEPNSSLEDELDHDLDHREALERRLV